MSAYEEMVERCARELFLDMRPDQSWTRLRDLSKEDYCGHARAVLDEAFRMLENVTPGMVRQWIEIGANDASPAGVWKAMLRASPPVAPAEKESRE